MREDKMIGAIALGIILSMAVLLGIIIYIAVSSRGAGNKIYIVRAEDLTVCIKNGLSFRNFSEDKANELNNLRDSLAGHVGIVDQSGEKIIDLRRQVEMKKGDLLWVLKSNSIIGYRY